MDTLNGVQMYLITSKEDGYLAALIVAKSAEDARKEAWEFYTSEARKDGEWQNYHSDPSELDVQEMGTFHWGADGEGNIEFG